MRVTSAELKCRLDVEVDPDAEPVDVDEAVARFLLAFVRNQSRSSSVAPAAEVEFPNVPER